MAPLRIVRAVNPSDKPFKDMCDSQPYLIPAGSESLIPYEAAVLWFGNPDTIDIDARRRDRTDEYMRVRVRYGVYEHEHLIGQIPAIEIFTLEGDKIHMVKDDPEGILNNPVVSDDTTLRSVQQQLLAMQAQQQQLLDAISKDPAAAQAIMQALKNDDDTPNNADLVEMPEPTIHDGEGNIPQTVDAPQPPQTQGGLDQPPIPPPASHPSTPPEDAPSRIKVG